MIFVVSRWKPGGSDFMSCIIAVIILYSCARTNLRIMMGGIRNFLTCISGFCVVAFMCRLFRDLLEGNVRTFEEKGDYKS